MEQIITHILVYIVCIYVAIPMVLFLLHLFIGVLTEIFNSNEMRELDSRIFTEKFYSLLIKFYPFLR